MLLLSNSYVTQTNAYLKKKRTENDAINNKSKLEKNEKKHWIAY